MTHLSKDHTGLTVRAWVDLTLLAPQKMITLLKFYALASLAPLQMHKSGKIGKINYNGIDSCNLYHCNYAYYLCGLTSTMLYCILAYPPHQIANDKMPKSNFLLILVHKWVLIQLPSLSPGLASIYKG